MTITDIYANIVRWLPPVAVPFTDTTRSIMLQQTKNETSQLWILDESPRAIAILRNKPVQLRSRKQLANILCATVVATQEIGRDRFTTDDVAEIAGIAIGTLYRYFDDKVAILDYLWPRRRDNFMKPRNFKKEQRQQLAKYIQERQEALADQAAEAEAAETSETPKTPALSLVG